MMLLLGNRIRREDHSHSGDRHYQLGSPSESKTKHHMTPISSTINLTAGFPVGTVLLGSSNSLQISVAQIV